MIYGLLCADKHKKIMNMKSGFNGHISGNMQLRVNRLLLLLLLLLLL